MPDSVRRTVRLLAASAAVSWIGVQISGALSSVIVLYLTNDLRLVGIPFFLFYLGSALAAYPAGHFMDRLGRLPVLVGGHLLAALGFLLGALAIYRESLALFLFGITVSSLGAGATYLTRLAAADLYPPARRGRGLALVVFANSLGALLGFPLIAAAEVVAIHLHTTYLFLAWSLGPFLSCAAALLVAAIRTDPRDVARQLQAQAPTPTTSTGNGAVAWRPLLVAGVALLLAQAAMGAVMSVAGASLQHTGHSATLISFTMTAHIVGMFLFAPVIGQLADRWGRRPLLVVSSLLLVAATGSVILLPLGPVFTLSLLLVGVGWSFAFIGTTTIVADVTRAGMRGRATGLIDLGAALAAALAALAAGWALGAGGLPGVGGLALALSVAILPTLLFLRPQPLPLPRPPPAPETP